jgi:Acyclic terpene utilisation family protein AtuA
MPDAKTLRIGAGAGFQGDRIEPAVVLASQGGLDYLVLECLAERTVAAAQMRRRQAPGTGFDPLLEARVEALLPFVARNGVRVLTNMGAADPLGAGKVVVSIARRLGLRVKVAVVTGDDVAKSVKPKMIALETGRPLGEHGKLVSANAYLGIDAILPALASGADVVITGRVADPSLFLAPLAYEFGWAPDDWDRLARGTVVGHLLECAGQITGGYFADPGVKDVPDLAHLGFPFADVDGDGFASISKVAGTGGVVTLATVKEQLLYEVTDPTGYVTPDVTADFTSVRLAEVGTDRVAVGGATGRPRTDTLKVSVGYLAGWIGEGEISYAGANARARADLAATVLRERLQDAVPDLRIDRIGIDSSHRSSFGHGHDPYEIRLRVAGRSDKRALAERIGWEVEALLTNGPAGGGGARKSVTERLGIVSTLLPRRVATAELVLLQSRYVTKAR